MYVSNQGSGTISKINISDGSIVNANWASGLDGPSGLTIDSVGTYMYVANFGGNSISRILMSDPTTIISSWVSGLNGPNDLLIDSTGTYIYVSNNGNGTISKILISDPTIIVSSWASGLSGPGGLTIDSAGTYMYVSNTNNGTVSRILISDPTIIDSSWASGVNGCWFLILDNTGTYMYATSYDNNTIYQILISDPTIIVSGWASGLDGPGGLKIYNNYIYVANYNNGNIGKYLQGPPPPLVCFKEGSKILTDNGYKPIETLRKGDLIKTLKHGFVPINMIGKRDIYNPAEKERIKDQLYKCSHEQYSELTEDLVITGCHSILVDNFISEEQKERVIEVNGNTYVTDNKYRLPACVDEKASIYEVKGNFTIYHIALDNDDYYMNYGVYANGLLVETCSKRYLKELSNMIHI